MDSRTAINDKDKGQRTKDKGQGQWTATKDRVKGLGQRTGTKDWDKGQGQRTRTNVVLIYKSAVLYSCPMSAMSLSFVPAVLYLCPL